MTFIGIHPMKTFSEKLLTRRTEAPTRSMTGFALRAMALFCTLTGPAQPALAEPADDALDRDYAAAREEMVREIERDVRATRNYLDRERLADNVLAAMTKVPRHEFVPPELAWAAYANQPLPIGHEQTISQPYIVAVMTDLLGLPVDCRVLEVGTGSGYQAAVLAELCAEVFSIEIVEALGIRARKLLHRLGYDNVTVRIGDGFAGWPEQGPYDAVIVTAVADAPPPPLLEQLKSGGRMIIPLRTGLGVQELVLIEKDTNNELIRRAMLPVRFVPLTGDHTQPTPEH
jgi:protein-L-isoaspartate(D-aspartate) O-methyltransferase